MATTTTALTMMNRLRRLHRFEDVTSFSTDDTNAKVLLDLLNESKRDVLESYRHAFDERSDLTFKTFPAQTGSTLTLTANSTTGAISSYAGEWIGKTSPERFYDATVYVVPTEDALFGGSALRIEDGYMITSSLLAFTLEHPWTSTSYSGDYKLFALEYALPSTVRGIISVRDQKGELQLRQAMSVYEFESAIPRPLDHTGADPEFAVVTGFRQPTHKTSDATSTGVWSDNGDYSLALYPIPGDGRVINLTYLYRHPELVNPTDELVGVPAHIVDSIVMLAHGKAVLTIEKDPARAGQIIDRIARSFATKASAEKPDPFRRRVAKSLDHVGGSAFGGRLKTPFYTP